VVNTVLAMLLVSLRGVFTISVRGVFPISTVLNSLNTGGGGPCAGPSFVGR